LISAQERTADAIGIFGSREIALFGCRIALFGSPLMGTSIKGTAHITGGKTITTFGGRSGGRHFRKGERPQYGVAQGLLVDDALSCRRRIRLLPNRRKDGNHSRKCNRTGAHLSGSVLPRSIECKA